MFKIKDSTIHCSRGDTGAFTLKLPITDVDNNVKYEDTSGNVYWYNIKKNELYDSNYNISDISLETLNIVYYEFQEGDKITFSIYEKNGYNKEPVMTKDINVTAATYGVYVELTEADTAFNSPINKPTTFWYDVTLNDDLTIICYDENDAKEFIQYPAKAKGDDE